MQLLTCQSSSSSSSYAKLVLAFTLFYFTRIMFVSYYEYFYYTQAITKMISDIPIHINTESIADIRYYNLHTVNCRLYDVLTSSHQRFLVFRWPAAVSNITAQCSLFKNNHVMITSADVFSPN